MVFDLGSAVSAGVHDAGRCTEVSHAGVIEARRVQPHARRQVQSDDRQVGGHFPAGAASVLGDRALASLKAVRDGRVHLSPTMPFCWVDFPPSVNRLIGLGWLAKILYPDKFPEDIRAQTRDFYTMFYHRTPDNSQIDHVLAGRD